MIAEQLDAAVRAILPSIEGVSIVRETPLEASIQFAPGTSTRDKERASAVLTAFVPVDKPRVADLEKRAIRAVLLSEAAKPGAAKELADYAEAVK